MERFRIGYPGGFYHGRHDVRQIAGRIGQLPPLRLDTGGPVRCIECQIQEVRLIILLFVDKAQSVVRKSVGVGISPP